MSAAEPHWLPTAQQLREHPDFPRFINRLLLHAVTLGDPVYECDECGEMDGPDNHDSECEGFADVDMHYPNADLVPHLGAKSNGSLIFDILPDGWIAEKSEDEYHCYIQPQRRKDTEQEGYHAGVTMAEAAAKAFLAVQR